MELSTYSRTGIVVQASRLLLPDLGQARDYFIPTDDERGSMADGNGLMCGAYRGASNDAGTRRIGPNPAPMCTGASPPVTSTPSTHLSGVTRAAIEVEISQTGNIAQLTYDAFIREYVYEPAARAISAQGEQLYKSGWLTSKQAAEWVAAQRNKLLLSIRDERNSPLGARLSEYLKPRDKLPQVSDLAAKYSSAAPEASSEEVFEAIIKSGARTRGSVNRLAVGLRWAGPVLVGVSFIAAGYLVYEAPPQERGRVAAQQVGEIGGGWAFGEAGCEAGAAIGVWFEGVGAVPGCILGAIVAGAAGGWGMGKLAVWTFDEANTVIEWQESPSK